MLHGNATAAHLGAKAMHPEEIKACIRMRGTTPAAIARQLGVSRMTVSHVIHGRGTSARIAKAIVDLTGKRFGDLWPGRYPEFEFVEAAGLASATAAQVEADLARATRRVLARKVSGVAA